MHIGKSIGIVLNDRLDFRRIVTSGVSGNVMDKLRSAHYSLFDVMYVNVYSTMLRAFKKLNENW